MFSLDEEDQYHGILCSHQKDLKRIITFSFNIKKDNYVHENETLSQKPWEHILDIDIDEFNSKHMKQISTTLNLY